ncbi:MAG: glycogen debranching protein GlgX [Gammaproteobacteria bacterium]|nr:glycogen debranching protein GlgX [Gammaproteobacteria bacterium]
MTTGGVTAGSAAAPAIESGRLEALGAQLVDGGVNFAVFAAHASAVWLELFESPDGPPVARFALPARSGDVWHGFVPSPLAGAGTLYGYRVEGPWAPDDGHRHNRHKLLVDPYAYDVVGELRHGPWLRVGTSNDELPDAQDSAAFVPRARVVNRSFDWAGDRSPATPWRDTLLYELHVKGYTMRHPEVPAEWRGKYLGLTVPAVIDHLRSLGVTAVELMPCHAFASEPFLVERGLTNYWGYNPYAWSAPARQYAVDDPVREFKQMVRALHAAGIEVILDVVFNHSAEGGAEGPTIGLRGLDNRSYYRLPRHELAGYENHSGCGNTLNADHPAVSALILDSLRYWMTDMHVDGFRFDLAPVLARTRAGFDPQSPIFAAMRADPALAYAKLIAEPWDVGPGGYQLGRFPAGWAEWNDRYRDTVRAFWRGDRRQLGGMAERIAGSSDLFRNPGRRPWASVNHVTAHDGFTLADLVSYNDRHNEANLEGNRDGHADNLSWNCGAEGPSSDPEVQALRARQLRNFLATLFLSQGTPMLLGGDEFGRTQQGNNNAYCQDSPIGWIDWAMDAGQRSLLEFVRRAAALRRARRELRRDTFFKGSPRHPGSDEVRWLHPDGREMGPADWADPDSGTLGVRFESRSARDLLVLACADKWPRRFRLPPGAWRCLLDSAAHDDAAGENIFIGERMLLPHSLCVLESEQAAAETA